jgi:hypothetical protein
MGALAVTDSVEIADIGPIIGIARLINRMDGQLSTAKSPF